MGQVDIAINGKTYRIACEDGEEQRLSNLAAMVDAHVHDLIEQVGQIGGLGDVYKRQPDTPFSAWPGDKGRRASYNRPDGCCLVR